jgi:hypothetical protein
MNFTAYPDVASALAAERHERFVATAEHSRRVSQLRRGRGDGSLAPRFVAALSRWLVDRTSEHTKGDVMDRKTFDALSRDLADGSTRRQFGKLFAALGLSTLVGVGLLGQGEVAAKNHRHKGKGKRKRVRRRKHRQQQNPPTTPQTDPQPVCVPDCEGLFGAKACGDDGCGGSCGECPFLLPICNQITFACEPIVSIP